MMIVMVLVQNYLKIKIKRKTIKWNLMLIQQMVKWKQKQKQMKKTVCARIKIMM